MSPRDNYFVATRQAQAPVGSARDDYDTLAALRAMGVEDKFTEGRDAGAWQRWMHDVTRQSMSAFGYELPLYDAFLERGWFNDELSEPAVILDKFRVTPSPITQYAIRQNRIFQKSCGFGYEDCPPKLADTARMAW